MDESKYCSGCGNELAADMQFCPRCGKVVSGSDAEKDIKEKEREITAFVLESRRTWLTFLLAVYAIPVVILGIIALADAGAIASSIYSSAEFHDWLISHGYSYSEADIQNYLTYAAAMVVGSGACALITMACLIIRKMWIVAVIACFISAMLCFWSIFGLLIGLLVAWQVFISKNLFIDNKPKA